MICSNLDELYSELAKETSIVQASFCYCLRITTLSLSLSILCMMYAWYCYIW